MQSLIRTSVAAAATLALAACGTNSTQEPTGSQIMTANSDSSALVIANSDMGTLTRFNPTTQAVEHLDLGQEPSRVTRIGNRYFVTLRGERRVAVAIEGPSGLELENTIDVGAEPYGIVSNVEGTKVYVAASLSNRVEEIDALSLQITNSWSVPNEPRWLAIHPSGETVYAATAFGINLYAIDIDSDRVEALALPPALGGATGDQPLTPRMTGDPAVAPDGFTVAVPSLYVDPVTEINDTLGQIPPTGYYGGGRTAPVVAVFNVGGNGAPIDDKGFPVLVSDFTVLGYPTSVTFGPDASTIYTTFEAAGGVVVTTIDGGEDPSTLGNLFANSGGNRLGFTTFPVVPVLDTGKGTRGVALLDGSPFSYSFIDRTVQALPADTISDNLQNGSSGFFGERTEITASPASAIYDDVLPEDVSKGRRLFFDNSSTEMSSSGLSCSTCHFDGRNDGLSWTFIRGKRQTPSLAGNISATEPVRWEGDRVTVAEDALRTAQDAMGGSGPNDVEAEQIAAFIDWTRDVDHETKGLMNAAAVRGKEIFEREDVACASCHYGERFTDNEPYEMFGMTNVRTRSLVGIAASAPYFHDGHSPTLRDLVVEMRSGAMGDTSNLTAEEIDDLTAYLEAL